MLKLLKNLLKVVSGILLVGSILLYGGGLLLTWIFSSHGAYGDVHVLQEGNVHVGDIVPMVFVVPRKYNDIHKEMWDCYINENDKLVSRYDYVLEGGQIEDQFTREEVQGFFENSPIDIYEGEGYSTRIALFIPEEPGTYVLPVMAYYNSTSPQGYGQIELSVLE